MKEKIAVGLRRPPQSSLRKYKFLTPSTSTLHPKDLAPNLKSLEKPKLLVSSVSTTFQFFDERWAIRSVPPLPLPRCDALPIHSTSYHFPLNDPAVDSPHFIIKHCSYPSSCTAVHFLLIDFPFALPHEPLLVVLEEISFPPPVVPQLLVPTVHEGYIYMQAP